MKRQQQHKAGIRVGVIGLPDDWENAWQPAFERLSGRVRITAVYDPCPERARRVAQSLRAAVVLGVLRLARRVDVDAVVVLRTGWHGHRLLPQIATSGKPVFLSSEQPELDTLEYLHSVVTMQRCVWIPRLEQRFSPATVRLMELIATRLGRPRQLEITAPRDLTSNGELVHVLDWCLFVLRLVSDTECSPLTPEGCRLRFKLPDGIAELNLRTGGRADKQRKVICERGEATLVSATEIRWTAENQSPVCESLANEHSAVALQLAIFLRRAAGGLIPTADLSDLHRSQVIAREVLCVQSD